MLGEKITRGLSRVRRPELRGPQCMSPKLQGGLIFDNGWAFDTFKETDMAFASLQQLDSTNLRFRSNMDDGSPAHLSRNLTIPDSLYVKMLTDAWERKRQLSWKS